jgi:Cu/Ag efflux pump CusA
MRLVIASIAALLIIFGITQLSTVPVDALPEFTRPYVEIQAEALGLSAAEVEAMVTTPLEADMLNGTAWVDEIRSESIPGLSSIVLIFKPGTDIMDARQMVTERLVEVFALPGVSEPPTMLNPVSSTSRILKVGLSSEELSLIDISVLARWTLVPRLMGVPGVANVSIWGQRKRQLQVQVDPTALRDNGVTLSQVIKSAGNALWASPLSYLDASTPGTGGWIDTPNQRLGVRHILPISTPEQLAQVVVDGTSLVLGDVANVVEEHQPLIGDALVEESPNLMLIIEKFPWANTIDVTNGVESTLKALQPGLSGVKMDPTLFRPATFLEVATSNLTTTLLIGGILALLAMFFFTFNWRSTLVILVSILVSIIVAVIVLYARGITPNMMLIAGLMMAMGLIIDDAIIDVENIKRRIREHREKGSDKMIATIIYEASKEMRGPIFFAGLVLALVVVPVFALEGLSGAIYQPIAISYLLALIASFIVSLIVTPALSILFFRNVSQESGDSPVAKALRGVYDTLFAWVVKVPRPAFVAVLLILVVGIITSMFMRQDSVVPAFKETDLLVRWDAPEGTSHPEMNRISALVSHELRSIPGVLNVSANVGRAVLSDRINDVNSAQIWVSINPSADYNSTVSAVKKVVEGYPGFSNEVLTYLQSKVRKELSGTDESLIVRVYGEDMNIIKVKAEEVQQVLANTDGIVDAKVRYPAEQPTLEIEVNLEAAKRYGIKPGDVRREATTLLGGIRVGSLFEEQKVFDVVVWGSPETRHSLSDIYELLINTPHGDHVQLKDVADIRIVPAVTSIKHDAVSRYMDVSVTMNSASYTSVVASIESGIAKINWPLEYNAEILGEYAEGLAARNKLMSYLVAAIILIFLLLQAASRSWKLAFAVFLTIPMVLTGGLLFAFISSNGLLSLGSIIGLVLVYGIAFRQIMVMIRRYQAIAKENDQSFGPELVMMVTKERFVPIVSTAVIMFVAVLPFAFFGNVPGLEIIHSMAITILGGVITSVLYMFLGFPALYLMFGAKQEPELDFVPDSLATEGGSA